MSSFILGPQRFGEISLVTLTLELQRAAAVHSIYAPPLGVHRRCLENLADSQQGSDELNVSIRVAVSKVGCSVYSALQRTQGKILLPNENSTLPPTSLVPFAAESLLGLAAFPRIEGIPTPHSDSHARNRPSSHTGRAFAGEI